MARYAAFLRGVSPMNLGMPELAKALEAAGFTEVKTLLSSGNAVFTAKKADEKALARRAEEAMEQKLGRTFQTTVRSIESLRAMIDADPYAGHALDATAKRVVTFTWKPVAEEQRAKLPIELHGARVLSAKGTEVFCAYVPNEKGPVFMTLLEKTFGKEITTRTWDTVAKVVKAGEATKK